MHRPCSDAPTELAHPAIETHREQSVVREGVRERVGRDVRVLTLHAGRIVAVARPVSADARQTRTREERGTL